MCPLRWVGPAVSGGWWGTRWWVAPFLSIPSALQSIIFLNYLAFKACLYIWHISNDPIKPILTALIKQQNNSYCYFKCVFVWKLLCYQSAGCLQNDNHIKNNLLINVLIIIHLIYFFKSETYSFNKGSCIVCK